MIGTSLLASPVRRHWLPIALGAVSALSVSTVALAQAEEGGTYVGLGGGVANYKYTNNPNGGSDFCNFPGLTYTSCRDDPKGFKAFVGYNVRPWLAVEASYINTGSGILEYDDTFLVSLGPPVVTTVGRVSERVSLSSFAVSGVFTAPLGPLYASARAGLSATTITDKYEVFGQTSGSDRTRARPLLGASVGGTFWRNLGVRLDWDRLDGTSTLGGKFRVDQVSLSATYRFPVTAP